MSLQPKPEFQPPPRWASLVAQMVKNLPEMWETWVSVPGKIPWIRERPLTPVFWHGELHGLYSPGGHRESDMSERRSHLI